jgi:hypothetical protein
MKALPWCKAATLAGLGVGLWTTVTLLATLNPSTPVTAARLHDTYEADPRGPGITVSVTLAGTEATVTLSSRRTEDQSHATDAEGLARLNDVIFDHRHLDCELKLSVRTPASWNGGTNRPAVASNVADATWGVDSAMAFVVVSSLFTSLST